MSDAIAQAIEALEAIDSEIVLGGQLKDILDEALAALRSMPRQVTVTDEMVSVALAAYRLHKPIGHYEYAAIRAALEAALAASAPPAVKGQEQFQPRVGEWMRACFGPEISADRQERNHRFIEEALELVQACGCTASEAHQLVDYVYGRDQGDINQEVGGVMVTLAALCLAHGFDMHSAGETELARVWTKIDKMRAKQAAKPKHSPLPEALATKSLHEEVCSDARKFAREIHEDCMAGPDEIADAIEAGFRFRERGAFSAGAEAMREACAKESEAQVLRQLESGTIVQLNKHQRVSDIAEAIRGLTVPAAPEHGGGQ